MRFVLRPYVRSVLAMILVGLVAAPAAANPRVRAVSLDRASPPAREVREPRDVRDAIPTPTPPSVREPGRRSSLAKGLPVRRPKADHRAPVEVSLWTNLQNKVYETMPHGGDDRAFSYTLMPMVINGAAESVPAVGLSGAF